MDTKGDWIVQARKDAVVSKIEEYQDKIKRDDYIGCNPWALLENIRAIRLEQLNPANK